jgi:hypothetical protein
MNHYAYAMYNPHDHARPKWYHLMLAPAIRHNSSFGRIAMHANYRANSIIDLTNKCYLKCREFEPNQIELDDDWIEILLEWPVTNLTDFYRENGIKTISGR